jgi:hypothetical protein
MEISDSACPVLLDGNASKREARAEVDAMPNNTLPDARRAAAVLRYYLRRASCVPRVPAADARTSKAVGSLRRHPSVAQHHWACV